MIALVFVIPKHSLQWRGEFHLYFALVPVPEFLLVNSAARLFLMAARFQGKLLFSFLYLLMRSLTMFGSAGIWADNLCPACQWKCWESDIRGTGMTTTTPMKTSFENRHWQSCDYFCDHPIIFEFYNVTYATPGPQRAPFKRVWTKRGVVHGLPYGLPVVNSFLNLAQHCCKPM